jgi:hypothetical protein
MKILLMLLLGIFALNALVILAVAGILMADGWRAKRRKARDKDAHAQAS